MVQNIIVIVLIIIAVIVDIYILWARTYESFVNISNSSESLYDLMVKDAQISNNIYITKLRNADVIQSNPWIMIDSITQNATTYPRGVIDRLTGQYPETLSWHPRSYYEYSDVLNTGLPL